MVIDDKLIESSSRRSVPRNAFGILLAVLLLVASIMIGCSTDGTGGDPSEIEPLQIDVQFDYAKAAELGYTGTITGKSVELLPGSSAIDTLEMVNCTAFISGGYVQAINGLQENDLVPGSGWTYSVNGYAPDQPANMYRLTSGDEVVWSFYIPD